MGLWVAVLAYLVLFMAAWTVAANAAYLSGQSLLTAVIVSAVLTALMVLGLRRLGDRKVGGDDRDLLAPLRRLLGRSAMLRSPWPAIVLVGLTVLLLIIQPVSLARNYVLYWAPIVLCFIVVLVRELALAPPDVTGEPSTQSDAWKVHFPILVLGLAAVVFSVVIVRPNPDDTTYLNRAAAVADMALQPLPHYWTVFPGTTTPFPYPSFPLAAYNDLVGALSWLTGLQPLAVCSFIITPLMAFALVAAWGALFQFLAPKAWPWMLIALVAFFMFDASSARFFTGFGFLRIWQGKSILVNVLTPLAYLLGLRFGSQGRWRDFALLTLTEIAMFGSSINALVQGPVVAVTAVAAGVLYGNLTIRKLVLSVLSSAYTLLFGILSYKALHNDLNSHVRKPISIPITLSNAFGSEHHLALWCILIVLSCLAVPDRRIRLFTVVTGLVALALFTNPLLADLVINRISTSSTYWRFFWLLPLPLMGAAVLALPVARLRQLPDRFMPAQIAVFAAVVAAYVLLVPDIYMASSGNDAVVSWKPVVKADPDSYETAVRVTAALPPRTEVLASTNLSILLPMMRGYVFPVAPRLVIVRNAIALHGDNEPEAALRMAVTNYLGTGKNYNPDLFIQAFHVWDIGAVVIFDPQKLAGRAEFFCLLSNAGFEPSDSADKLWIRTKPNPETFVTTCPAASP